MPSPPPLRIVRTVLGTTVHVARTVTELGVQAAGAVAAEGVRRVSGRVREPADDAPAAVPGDTPEPVNVVEELDLDPAPVETDQEPGDEAVTSIDAQADPHAVDVTPDEVARQMGRHPDTD